MSQDDRMLYDFQLGLFEQLLKDFNKETQDARAQGLMLPASNGARAGEIPDPAPYLIEPSPSTIDQHVLSS